MITSTSNNQVKYIRSLGASRRLRHSERFFVLEGVRLVAEAIRAHMPIALVLYAPEQLEPVAGGHKLLTHIATLPQSHEATPHVIATAAQTVTPQGVVAVVPYPTISPQAGLWLVLDEIQDPGNVGTLLRSAEAVGVGQVLCSRGTADVYSPKVVRAAMGAHFSLAIQEDLDWQTLQHMLFDRTAIYAAVAHAKTPYYAIDYIQPTGVALIIGNEAHGISALAHACATHTITIPMIGNAESLNAGVAGSIILFDMLRQQRTQQ